jgi:uncharacterized membrane protein YdfJ with MMPL/SSD domain
LLEAEVPPDVAASEKIAKLNKEIEEIQ